MTTESATRSGSILHHQTRQREGLFGLLGSGFTRIKPSVIRHPDAGAYAIAAACSKRDPSTGQQVVPGRRDDFWPMSRGGAAALERRLTDVGLVDRSYRELIVTIAPRNGLYLAFPNDLGQQLRDAVDGGHLSWKRATAIGHVVLALLDECTSGSIADDGGAGCTTTTAALAEATGRERPTVRAAHGWLEDQGWLDRVAHGHGQPSSFWLWMTSTSRAGTTAASAREPRSPERAIQRSPIERHPEPVVSTEVPPCPKARQPEPVTAEISAACGGTGGGEGSTHRKHTNGSTRQLAALARRGVERLKADDPSSPTLAVVDALDGGALVSIGRALDAFARTAGRESDDVADQWGSELASAPIWLDEVHTSPVAILRSRAANVGAPEVVKRATDAVVLDWRAPLPTPKHVDPDPGCPFCGGTGVAVYRRPSGEQVTGEACTCPERERPSGAADDSGARPGAMPEHLRRGRRRRSPYTADPGPVPLVEVMSR